MTSYFIINNQSPAATYGIGTYVKHLGKCLQQVDDIRIVHVDIQAAVEEFTISYDERQETHLQMPYYALEDEWYNRCIFYYLSQWINKNAFDDRLIFHFNFDHHASLAYWLKEEYFNSKIIFTVHYQLWSFALKGNRDKLRTIIAQKPQERDENGQRIIASMEAEKRMFRIADYVHCLSTFTKETLLHDYHIEPSKIVCIPNFVEDNHCDEAEVLPCFNDSNKRYILYVGRLVGDKGTKWLIEAFKIIHQQCPNTHLVVIGDGDFSVTRVAEGIWEHVTFTGHLAQTTLFKLYTTAALGIHPSLTEQCSYTLIEMMMHGLPIVTTDCTGISEMLATTPHCLLPMITSKDEERQMIDNIASKSLALLNNEKLRHQTATSLRETYLEHYASCKPYVEFLKQTKCQAILSEDMLCEFDSHALGMIDQQPKSLDLDFFGLTGLSLYLLWRVKDCGLDLKKQTLLEEYLIYAIDWMIELAEREACSTHEMTFLVRRLQQCGFYPLGTQKLSARVRLTEGDTKTIQASLLLQNQLALYNYKY